jgi:hypothetical protein
MRRGLVGSLYDSGVRYEREAPGFEDWQTAAETLRRGVGDCEDLVIWRVAELREQGIPARAIVLPLRRRLWHVVVRHPDGMLEDPSTALGMRAQDNRTMDDHRDVTTAPELGADAALDDADADDDGAELGADEAALADAGDVPEDDGDPLDDLADADAPPPAAVRPSVKWAVTPRRDGTHDALVTLSLTNGKEVRATVHARTRRAALARVAQLAKRAASSSAVRALLPPQAAIAVKGLSALANLAKKGKVGKVMGKLRSRGLRLLAKALS